MALSKMFTIRELAEAADGKPLIKHFSAFHMLKGYIAPLIQKNLVALLCPEKNGVNLLQFDGSDVGRIVEALLAEEDTKATIKSLLFKIRDDFERILDDLTSRGKKIKLSKQEKAEIAKEEKRAKKQARPQGTAGADDIGKKGENKPYDTDQGGVSELETIMEALPKPEPQSHEGLGPSEGTKNIFKGTEEQKAAAKNEAALRKEQQKKETAERVALEKEEKKKAEDEKKSAITTILDNIGTLLKQVDESQRFEELLTTQLLKDCKFVLQDMRTWVARERNSEGAKEVGNKVCLTGTKWHKLCVDLLRTMLPDGYEIWEEATPDVALEEQQHSKGAFDTVITYNDVIVLFVEFKSDSNDILKDVPKLARAIAQSRAEGTIFKGERGKNILPIKGVHPDAKVIYMTSPLSGKPDAHASLVDQWSRALDMMHNSDVDQETLEKILAKGCWCQEDFTETLWINVGKRVETRYTEYLEEMKNVPVIFI